MDIDIDIDKYIRPAWIIDRRILEHILEKDFLHLCKDEGLDGCVVLYCPSLETFDPLKDNQGVRPLKRMWVDTYGGKNADIVLLVPWNVTSHCPPNWLGVEHLTHLVNWLAESCKEKRESELILAKQFGEVANRIQVLLCNLDTITAGSRNPSVDDAGSREPYAFGIYFYPYSFDNLNKFFQQEGQVGCDTITKVRLILGTSIGKPFSIFNNGKFTYNLFLRFNGESAVPNKIRDKISCVVLEHIKLVVEAFKGRCCPDIPAGYCNEFSMNHGVTSIENTFMPFWDFLSLIFLQINCDNGKLQLTKPNDYQNDRLLDAKRAAR